jgi:glucose/arabinose dehydrogenase
MDGGLTLDASTEEAVMTLLQPNNNHNGGNIAFGPDGYLYAGWGDGGGEGDPLDNAQNTSNLFGTFTRIDVDGGAPYAIPADNPFAANAACVQGNGADACPEIFAGGLRNPWRWSFDATTGELWAGDVGQGAVEEVDIITLGGNYGWRCREGTRLFDDSGVCPGGFVEPITEYGRSSGQSITGGYVYRGNAIPDLQGWYVFGDFVSGRIFAVPADSPPGTPFTSLLTTALSIASFAVDSAGELYVVDFGGDLFRIVAAP